MEWLLWRQELSLEIQNLIVLLPQSAASNFPFGSLIWETMENGSAFPSLPYLSLVFLSHLSLPIWCFYPLFIFYFRTSVSLFYSLGRE